MIDTHCHIYLDHFRDDLKDVLDRAASVGVKQVLMPAIDFESLGQMDRVSHPEIQFHKMAGIHPCEIDGNSRGQSQKLFDLCADEAIIAVGETGLDYYWSTDFIKEQKNSLHHHCEVAKALKKPIVLHNRDATPDLLDIIEEEQNGSLTGVWHCFNGSVDEGKRAMDAGLFLGIGGVVTFKNAGVDKSVAGLPPDAMMLETDAPYLTPAPHRGKRNEPAYVELVAKKLAKLFGLSLEEIDRITTENAKRLFEGI